MRPAPPAVDDLITLKRSCLMRRRTFLVWFSRTVYTTCAAVVAVPIARFFGESTMPSNATLGPLRQRVTRLDSLKVGEPQLLPVTGSRQDAWVRHPNRVIGNVWVNRISPPSVPPQQAKLTVFNASCPHSGCPIQQAMKRGYVCHCHGARFKTDGEKVTDLEGFANPSPRGMDPLDHSVVQDEITGDWWLEVVYKEYEVGLAERIEKA